MKSETKLWLAYADENYEHGIKLQKTHNINTLVNILAENKIFVDISEYEINLIDSIYMTSKYPLGSVLEDFEPNENICKECLIIAESIFTSSQTIVELYKKRLV